MEYDSRRIEEELTKVPTREDLENLEAMASRVRGLLGNDMNIPDQDKRTVMEMLNLRVIVTPDKRMKIAGWFTPQNGLLSTSQLWQQSRNFAGQFVSSHVKYIAFIKNGPRCRGFCN